MLTDYFVIARCWGHHARYTQYNPGCEELIIKFLENYENLQHSVTFIYSITPVWIDSEQIVPVLDVSLVHVASYFGLKRIVEKLLNGGAAANASTHFGTTALHSVQDLEIASLLLKFGAEIDFVDSDGRTPLMHHAWYDNVVMVEKLLESGADINAASKVGYTPFQEVSTIYFLSPILSLWLYIWTGSRRKSTLCILLNARVSLGGSEWKRSCCMGLTRPWR